MKNFLLLLALLLLFPVSVFALPTVDLTPRQNQWLAADLPEGQKLEALVKESLENGKNLPAGQVRSLNGKQLAQILPGTTENPYAQVQFSSDDGKTWTEPRRLTWELAGAGHVMRNLNDGRILCAFRAPASEEKDFNPKKDGFQQVIWVGNFLDLEQGSPGIYRMNLGKITDPAAALSPTPCAFDLTQDGQIVLKVPGKKPRWFTMNEGAIGGIDWSAMQMVHYDLPEVVEGCEPVLTPPPAGAVVLFDGNGLDAFDGGRNWTVTKDWIRIGKGSIKTKQKFGSFRLHVEFCTPAEVTGKGQGRGNSGIYIMERYEVQILDSWRNDTYPQGQCGAVYTQNPPLKNVCRKPGEWQSYDIWFTAPKFDSEGELLSPARITVWQNGVLIQNDFEIIGRNWFIHRYLPHEAKEPLLIQDHNCPVRFRNIWIQEGNYEL